LAEEQLQEKNIKVKKAKPPPPKPQLLHVPGRAFIFDQGFSKENLDDHVESVHHFKSEIQEVEIEEEIEEEKPGPDDAPAPEGVDDPPSSLLKRKP